METARHSAIHPTKRPTLDINGSAAELALLDFYQRYDILPSHYAQAYFFNVPYIRKLHTRLMRGHYIGIPESAIDHARKRNVFYPLELRPRGEALLKEKGRWLGRTKGNDALPHRIFRSQVQFSFDYAEKTIRGLRIKRLAEILADERCPEATRTATDPSRFRVGHSTVVPDAPIFGLEWNGSAVMFLHGFEVDDGTETGERVISENKKKTIAEMFAAYAEYLERDGPYERYGISRISIPVITTSKRRMENFIDILKRTVEPRFHDRFLFKYAPHYRDGYLPATAHIVTEPWARAGEPLDMLFTLKATAERRSHGPAREGEASAGVEHADTQSGGGA